MNNTLTESDWLDIKYALEEASNSSGISGNPYKQILEKLEDKEQPNVKITYVSEWEKDDDDDDEYIPVPIKNIILANIDLTKELNKEAISYIKKRNFTFDCLSKVELI